MSHEIFQPNFAGSLLPVITQDVDSKEVLMLAWMNEEAFEKTLSTGYAHYWSRSRKKLWRKGESSGNQQKIKSVRLDCDRDAILLLVEQEGKAACHTGHVSCFFTQWQDGQISECSPVVFDPKQVYGA